MAGPATPAAPRLPLLRRLKRHGVALLMRLIPFLYGGLLGLVERTSRIHLTGVNELFERVAAGERVVTILPHQDIVLLPWLVRNKGWGTLASVGDAGDIITAGLEPFGFNVARGGSSSRSSRRTMPFEALVTFAEEEMTKGTGGFVIAITPDGSRGPALACKPGFAVVAARTGAKIYCMKAYCRRARYLKTWDHTAIPLPFSEIWFDIEGPFEMPENPTREEIEETRRQSEAHLHEMNRRAFARAGQPLLPATLHTYTEDQRDVYTQKT
ncbi:MAG: lysophospholipid acyltransferase (LPLAT)-like uncharacterized protein [Hyphomicrobiaceae bacterium]|jgi:lysophospholipid acyltransferase (LPLAT)-like uncharacterized protein